MIDEPGQTNWQLHAVLNFDSESKNIKSDIQATGKNEIAVVFEPLFAYGNEIKVGLIINFEGHQKVLKDELFTMNDIDWTKSFKMQVNLVEIRSLDNLANIEIGIQILATNGASAKMFDSM